MVGNDVDVDGQTLEVVTPDLETFKDGEQLLVVCVVVELGHREGLRVECDRVDLTIQSEHREDASESVVGHISFDHHLAAGQPMCEDRSLGEGFLKRLKGGIGLQTPVKDHTLAGQMSQWNNDIQITEDEMMVKVRETKERLYLFKAAGSWPFEDGVDF